MDDDLRKRLRGSGGFGPVRPARPTPPPRPLRPATPLEPVAPPAPKPEPEPPTPSPHLHPILEKQSPRPPKKKRSIKKKPIIIIIVILLVLGVAFGLYKRYQASLVKKREQKVTEAAKELGEIKPTGTIRLIASGDNMTFESVNNTAKKPDGSYDYTPLYSKVKPFFDKADVRVCNETVPAGGTALGISGFPSFNAPPAFAKGLADVGCNVINLGTNHINDKGQPGVDASISYWDNQTQLLAVAGANRSAEEQNKIRYFTVKQVKFAFLSYTTGSNTAPAAPFSVNTYSDSLAEKQVSEARKNAQFVIVNMNWGAENSSDINQDQDRIAQSLANLNADIIIGNGPHVLQPAKILDSKNNTNGQ